MNITRNAIVTLLIASIAGVSVPVQAQCLADLVPDGRIDGADLGVLLAYWGPTNSSAFSLASDLNQDGSVDGSDLGTLLARWGACPPVVTSISPNAGVLSGGTSVVIAGGFFAGTSSVKFGGIPAASFAISSSTQITAITPPGALGPVDVEVSSPAGTSTLVDGFVYANISVPSWATLIESLPDPSVVTDPVLRQRIIASGYAWRVRHTGTQIEMLLVPPGTFQMGCVMGSDQYECASNELPVHQVTLTNAFYLGRYEVTQAQWVHAMGSNPSLWPGANRPVENVSWNTIQGYLSATDMRLPTEAEWEYACRAGTQTPFYNGSTDDDTVSALAWFAPNYSDGTRPVGGKDANAFGFHDMLGNVWESVSDWYAGYSADSQINPTGPASSTHRVFRGGAFYGYSDIVRSSARNFGTPADGGGSLGFRVARNP